MKGEIFNYSNTSNTFERVLSTCVFSFFSLCLHTHNFSYKKLVLNSLPDYSKNIVPDYIKNTVGYCFHNNTEQKKN